MNGRDLGNFRRSKKFRLQADVGKRPPSLRQHIRGHVRRHRPDGARIRSHRALEGIDAISCDSVTNETNGKRDSR